jgi:hypothetical protein
MSQRLLNVDRLTERHGQHSLTEVGMVSCCYKHRINLIGHLIEHHAEVSVALRVGVFFLSFLRVLAFQIDIAEGHNVAMTGAVERPDIGTALIADPNGSHVYLSTWWLFATGTVSAKNVAARHD